MMIVRGKAYRTNLPGTLQLGSIKRMSREFGFGWATVQDYMRSLDDDAKFGDLLCEDRFLAWMFVWMVNAGDDLTRADLETLQLGDIEFTQSNDAPDPGGEVEAPPTSAPTGSGRGEGASRKRPAVKRTAASTRTSRKR